MIRWIPLLLACAGLASCSKADKNAPPQLFLPRVLGAQGQDLDARRALLCNPKQVDLRDNLLTPENFKSMFQCANYDSSLDQLEPLMTSVDFPELLQNLNLVLKSDNTKSMKETLRGWLEDGPEGNSRADRLLPFLSSLIKNPSFRTFLPVFDGVLQAGKGIWRDLLPGIADVIYTERFPDNIENAFEVMKAFSGGTKSELQKQEEKDYAKTVKDFANFLKSDVDGKTASLTALELVNQVRDIVLPDTSIYQFLDHMLEKGTISTYFLDAGAVRGEVLDPKLNESADDASIACPGLNETPEQRQQCAHERMFKRPAGGGEAPLTQLAGLVAEFQKDHPEFLPSLAGWFSANGPRVVNGISEYIINAQVVTNISKLNVGNFILQYAKTKGMGPNEIVTGDQFAALATEAFASPNFAVWVEGILPAFNREAFGERNAKHLKAATLNAEIPALYKAPEVGTFAKSLITTPSKLSAASSKFNNKHRSDSLLVNFGGSQKNIEQHLCGMWWNAVITVLGEDIVLDYVVKLAQTLLNQMANSFKDKGVPISEWYFTSPYGNPATTEMLAGYAVKELDMLPKYYKNKEWLKNEFTEEAFTNDDDKRAFRLLVDQIPNAWQYVKSGMSRSGGDLTRALAKDKNNYLVKTYVNLIVKATETGWVSKGVRLIEAYQQRPDRPRSTRGEVSDEIADRRKFKIGLEALERIYRSLVEPERAGAYEDTSTLGRLVKPLSSIVSDSRRTESERFLLTSADQLLSLSDQEINDFFRDLDKAKPPGSVSERRETFRAVAEMLRHGNFPDLVKHLAGLFRENAVQPALDFLQKKIDDGSLPKMLLFIRRILGFGSVG